MTRFMKNIKVNLTKIKREINKKLESISKKEIISETDDVPIALNILKILDLCEKGDFYGTVNLKILGVKSRNLRLTEMSFKLTEELVEYLEE